jgi:predicted dehydrogenase
MDLMIHDIDVLLSLSDSPVASVTAASAADDKHVVAQVTFEDGLLGTLTASRVSEQRVRDLAITAKDSKIMVDYMDQSVQIHRHSLPEYVADDGGVRYRNESLIEQPMVSNGEPLKAELQSFVECVQSRSEPAVTAEDGLRAVEVADRIEESLDENRERTHSVLDT